MSQNNNPQQITYIDAIRARPGMYIGGTDTNALHHMIYEVLDNTLEQAIAGQCRTINIILQPDDVVTVEDNGPGIPIIYDEERDLTSFDLIFTMMNEPGSNMIADLSPALKVAGGLHGVGLTAVNALSERLMVETRRDGQHVRQTFERGQPTADLTTIGSLPPDAPTGTTITFKPDPEIFPSTAFDADKLKARLDELAHLVYGTTITLRDERQTPREIVMFSEHGISDYLAALPHHAPLIGQMISVKRTLKCRSDETGGPYQLEADIALRFTKANAAQLFLWVNTVRMYSDYGYLVPNGICYAVKRVTSISLSNYYPWQDVPHTLRLDSEQRLPIGLQGAVSLRYPVFRSENSMKTAISNLEIEFAIAMMVYDGLLAARREWTDGLGIFRAIAAHVLEPLSEEPD